jgi:hypothetical protein
MVSSPKTWPQSATYRTPDLVNAMNVGINDHATLHADSFPNRTASVEESGERLDLSARALPLAGDTLCMYVDLPRSDG